MTGLYTDTANRTYEVRYPTKADVPPKVKPEEGRIFYMRCTNCMHRGEFYSVTEKYLRSLIDFKCFVPKEET